MSTSPPRQSPLSDNSGSIEFGVWLNALAVLLDSAPTPAIDREFTEFIAAHRLTTASAQLRQDYRRLRLLFEALRDGGFWHLRWAVTDQEPSSRMIWRSWIRDPVRPEFDSPSATAECDELSALFGMLARHLQIQNVGLFYPTWNHTIAVWAPLAGKAKTPLVHLPTTQIFLECNAGFDQTTFRTQLRNIERYPNWDVHRKTQIPDVRAAWLLRQIEVFAGASPALWSLVRAKRAYAMNSSMGACLAVRSEWFSQLKDRMTASDVAALRAIGAEELGLDNPSPSEVLTWLKG